MSIEQALAENTAALNALAAIMKGATVGVPAAAGTAEKAPRGAKGEKAEPAAPIKKPGYEAKHTKAEAQAAANELKEAKGVAAAKAAIKAVGYDKLADIEKAEDIDKLYDLCKEQLGEEEEM